MSLEKFATKKLIKPRKETLLKRKLLGLSSKGHKVSRGRARRSGVRGDFDPFLRNDLDRIMGIDQDMYFEQGIDVYEGTPDSFQDAFEL